MMSRKMFHITQLKRGDIISNRYGCFGDVQYKSPTSRDINPNHYVQILRVQFRISQVKISLKGGAKMVEFPTFWIDSRYRLLFQGASQ